MQKTKGDYFKQLDNKVVSDTRKFWQTIRFKEKILENNNRTIMNNRKLTETFNTFFKNITQNLEKNSNFVTITENFSISDLVLKTIKKYEKHPCILKIKEKIKHENISCSFSFVTKETILNYFHKLNPKKACLESDIPVKIIKENLDSVSNFFYNTFIN